MSADPGAARLLTLGGLSLEGAAFARPKPLLLAAYLALEGRQTRQHLAELFFAGAERPRDSLAVTLSRLRSGLGAALRAEGSTVEVDLRVDAREFLAALEADEGLTLAEASYRGPFLEGVAIGDAGVEVEEWACATREFLAGRLRAARLRRAEALAGAGRLAEAGRLAATAWRTAGAPEAEPPETRRLLDVLRAADHPDAARVAAALRAWGVDPDRALDREPASDHGATSGGGGSGAAADDVGPVADDVGPAAAGAVELVGRERDLAALRAALVEEGARVLTLVGPGGIGKTRLAQRLAADLSAEGVFEAIHAVPLAEIADGGQVVARIAQAVGVDAGGAEDPAARLARALRGRRALLCLDNAEHVAEEVARWLEAAAAAPAARWLVTSREPLGVGDERSWVVGALAVPPAHARDEADIRAAPAVELLVRRRRRLLGPDRAGDDPPQLARVARALGGWPLALEIAASLARVLPLSELADELEVRLDLLVHPEREDPDRHASVVRVLDASWARLPERDRGALARLSVFAAGFSRADAEGAVGVSLASLARLLERGLLRVHGDGRFELHPLVARYAGERLRASGEEPRWRAAHAAHFAERLRAAEPDLRGPRRDEAAAALARDHANLREAWLGAVRRGEDGAWTSAALGFGRYLLAVGRYRAGAAWFAEARERARAAGLDPAVEGVVGWALGSCLARVARFEDAAEALGAALATSDPALRAEAHEELGGQVLYWQGRFAASADHLERAATWFADRGDRLAEARCTFLAANTAWARGDLAGAEGKLDEALRQFRGHADRMWTAMAVAALGVVAMDRGDLVAAERLLEEAARAADGLLSDHARALVTANLADLRCRQGRGAEVAAALEDAVATFDRVGDDPWVAEACGSLARVRARAGDVAGVAGAVRMGLTAALRAGYATGVAVVLAALADAVAERDPVRAAAWHEGIAARDDVVATTRAASEAALRRLRGAPRRAGVAADPAGASGSRAGSAGAGDRRGADDLLAEASRWSGEGRVEALLEGAPVTPTAGGAPPGRGR